MEEIRRKNHENYKRQSLNALTASSSAVIFFGAAPSFLTSTHTNSKWSVVHRKKHMKVVRDFLYGGGYDEKILPKFCETLWNNKAVRVLWEETRPLT